MQAWRDFKQTQLWRALIGALIAGMYWVWWDSFHEIGRFFMQVPLHLEPLLTRFSSLSCASKPIGVVLGCIVICILLSRSKGFFTSKKLPLVLFIVEVLLHILYYLAVLAQSYVAACLTYIVISAIFVLSILIVSLQMRGFEKRELVIVVIGSIVCFGLFNNLLFPYFLVTIPLPIISAFYLVILVGAYLLSSRFSPQTLESHEPHRERNVKTPPPLIVHLLIYGLAFGILHAFGGSLARGPYSVNIAVFFACLVTIACLAFLFLRKNSNLEIWSKIRSTVFPLSIIGYLLLPLVENYDAALALTEAGNLLYNALFFLACFSLMQKTFVDPLTIVTKGLLFKNIGIFAGVFGMRVIYDYHYLDNATHSILSVIIVLLLTIATFWVGSDEQIRKIWGLRKNLSPKKYNDLMLKRKCTLISNDHKLTTRESEILLMLGQGLRAPEITEHLGVSVETVRSHIKHLYAKLNVHSLTDLHKLIKNTIVDDGELEMGN